MELDRETRSDVNIVTEAEVCTYTYSGAYAREVIIRVDLGDNAKPIAANGVYVMNVYIDDVCLSPSSSIDVPAGRTKTIIISRAIPLETGDVISIRVTGLAGDTQVNSITSIRDATPAQLTDLTGPGSVMVDHDYGGDDELAYKTSAGNGIDGAEIRAYLQTDYDSGNTANNYVVARSNTKVGGKWVAAMMLDPAEYTLVFYKQGSYGPDSVNITVS